MASQAREDALVDRVAQGRERDDPQREIRVARHIGHAGAQELRRSRTLGRVPPCRDEAERGPGGQRGVGNATLLGEAAVRALTAGEERRRARGRAGRSDGRAGEHDRQQADREPPHAHTTSV